MTSANGVNPDTDLHMLMADLERETGSIYDWVTWPTGVWIDVDDQGNERVINLPERAYATKVDRMIRIDGQASQVFEVLTLPLLSADWSIQTPTGDTGQAEFVRNVILRPGIEGGMQTSFEELLGEMSLATAVKRTYHEKVWTRDDKGRSVYDRIAWRPPGACELIRDLRSGRVAGFREYMDFGLHQHGDDAVTAQIDKDGYVEIPSRRALIYIHGQRRDPVNGISSMEATWNAYALKEKLLSLWLTFLGTLSIPRVLAYGRDPVEAKNNAMNIAKLRTGGVAPVTRPEAALRMFDILDNSGKGADQFSSMIAYLDQAMTHSVLAGFLDLTRQATGQGAAGARGSHALNQGSMDMFLQSRTAIANEMARIFTHQVIAPMVWRNYGMGASIPSLICAKLTADQVDKVMAMLTAIGASTTFTVPPDFIGLLIVKAAAYLDMDEQQVEQMVMGHVEAVAKTAAGPLSAPAQVSAATDKISQLIQGSPASGAAPTTAPAPTTPPGV